MTGNTRVTMGFLITRSKQETDFSLPREIPTLTVVPANPLAIRKVMISSQGNQGS